VGIAVGKGLLYGVDGEERGVGRRLGMANKKCINEFLNLEIGRGDVLDYGGEVGKTGLLVGYLWVVSISGEIKLGVPYC
jgi:hypothetical protein